MSGSSAWHLEERQTLMEQGSSRVSFSGSGNDPKSAWAGLPVEPTDNDNGVEEEEEDEDDAQQQSEMRPVLQQQTTQPTGAGRSLCPCWQRISAQHRRWLVALTSVVLLLGVGVGITAVVQLLRLAKQLRDVRVVPLELELVNAAPQSDSTGTGGCGGGGGGGGSPVCDTRSYMQAKVALYNPSAPEVSVSGATLTARDHTDELAPSLLLSVVVRQERRSSYDAQVPEKLLLRRGVSVSLWQLALSVYPGPVLAWAQRVHNWTSSGTAAVAGCRISWSLTGTLQTHIVLGLFPVSRTIKRVIMWNACAGSAFRAQQQQQQQQQQQGLDSTLEYIAVQDSPHGHATVDMRLRTSLALLQRAVNHSLRVLQESAHTREYVVRPGRPQWLWQHYYSYSRSVVKGSGASSSLGVLINQSIVMDIPPLAAHVDVSMAARQPIANKNKTGADSLSGTIGTASTSACARVQLWSSSTVVGGSSSSSSRSSSSSSSSSSRSSTSFAVHSTVQFRPPTWQSPYTWDAAAAAANRVDTVVPVRLNMSMAAVRSAQSLLQFTLDGCANTTRVRLRVTSAARRSCWPLQVLHAFYPSLLLHKSIAATPSGRERTGLVIWSWAFWLSFLRAVCITPSSTASCSSLAPKTRLKSGQTVDWLAQKDHQEQEHEHEHLAREALLGAGVLKSIVQVDFGHAWPHLAYDFPGLTVYLSQQPRPRQSFASSCSLKSWPREGTTDARAGIPLGGDDDAGAGAGAGTALLASLSAMRCRPALGLYSPTVSFAAPAPAASASASASAFTAGTATNAAERTVPRAAELPTSTLQTAFGRAGARDASATPSPSGKAHVWTGAGTGAPAALLASLLTALVDRHAYGGTGALPCWLVRAHVGSIAGVGSGRAAAPLYAQSQSQEREQSNPALRTLLNGTHMLYCVDNQTSTTLDLVLAYFLTHATLQAPHSRNACGKDFAGVSFALVLAYKGWNLAQYPPVWLEAPGVELDVHPRHGEGGVTGEPPLFRLLFSAYQDTHVMATQTAGGVRSLGSRGGGGGVRGAAHSSSLGLALSTYWSGGNTLLHVNGSLQNMPASFNYTASQHIQDTQKILPDFAQGSFLSCYTCTPDPAVAPMYRQQRTTTSSPFSYVELQLRLLNSLPVPVELSISVNGLSLVVPPHPSSLWCSQALTASAAPESAFAPSASPVACQLQSGATLSLQRGETQTQVWVCGPMPNTSTSTSLFVRPSSAATSGHRRRYAATRSLGVSFTATAKITSHSTTDSSHAASSNHVTVPVHVQGTVPTCES